MLESITDFDINGKFAAKISALFDDRTVIMNGVFTLHHQGKYAEAIEYYDRVLESNSYDANGLTAALTGKGNVLSEQGKYAEAIEYYDKALAFDKADVEALASKGTVLIKQNNYPLAMNYLDKALSINPNSV